jgi:hypothetical protein
MELNQGHAELAFWISKKYHGEFKDYTGKHWGAIRE